MSGQDRSEEMLRERVMIMTFGGRSLPCSETFGLTEKRWEEFSVITDLVSIVFGKWTKEELLFLLENKKNAINPMGDSSTVVYCPKERRDELVGILIEKFGKLIFGEKDNGRTYIAADNERYILFIDDEGGGDFLMHCKGLV